MRACYLDSSALVKLATLEAETDALRQALENCDLRVTSRIAGVEVARALDRRGLTVGAVADAMAGTFAALALVELDAAIEEAAGRLEPPALRSLDAIHLASALSIGEELSAVVTYDARLAEAARNAGLEVLAPASSR